MGRKSSISRLPKDVKSYIEGQLAEGRCTLNELIADLHAKFPAQQLAGDLPSRAAVHRYGQKLERSLIAVKASTEAARMICASTEDTDDSRSEALTALVQTKLFDAILDLQEADEQDMDASERVGVLSNAAKNIATLTRSSVNLKQYRSKVREATRAAASAVASTVKKAGLSDETVAEIKARILGIVDDGAKP